MRSVVAADALRAGMAVDDVVFVGSPGVRARTAAELARHGTAIHAERAPFDAVASSEAFGRDPTDPRFGATRLATGDGVIGHSDYFDEGTVALANLAAVVTQRNAELDVMRPSTAELAIGHVDDVWEAVVEAPVDRAQAATAVLADVRGAGALVEEANRIVDVAQRAVSPDAAGDLLSDAWAVISGAAE